MNTTCAFALCAALTASAVCPIAAAENPADPLVPMTPGGANGTPVGDPPPLAISVADLAVGVWAVQVPTGTWQAQGAGAAAYSVPGPVVRLRWGQGSWFGHSYIEGELRALAFTGSIADGVATLLYTFEGDARWKLTLRPAGDALLISEELNGMRVPGRWVLDLSHGWSPQSGLALGPKLDTAAGLVLPCFYDKPEVVVRPAELAAWLAAPTAEAAPPAGLGVLSADPTHLPGVLVWSRELPAWKQADRLGYALWQHRQRPGEPGTRHFWGPETKSDGTPNPRTAAMIGQSLYEAHVTIEFALGDGIRNLGLGMANKGKGDQLFAPFKALAQQHR